MGSVSALDIKPRENAYGYRCDMDGCDGVARSVVAICGHPVLRDQPLSIDPSFRLCPKCAALWAQMWVGALDEAMAA